MDHTVLPQLTCNYTNACLYLVSVHQMAPPQTEVADINCSLLVIYLPRKDERLSRPGWLTYSGRFTHRNGHPSAAGRVYKYITLFFSVNYIRHLVRKRCCGTRSDAAISFFSYYLSHLILRFRLPSNTTPQIMIYHSFALFTFTYNLHRLNITVQHLRMYKSRVWTLIKIT